MKCKYDKCDNEVTGKQTYCSDTCRKRTSRTSKSDTDKSDNELGHEVPKRKSIQLRPPCTGSQLTSSCLTCTDKPTCSYLRNWTSAKPTTASSVDERMKQAVDRIEQFKPFDGSDRGVCEELYQVQILDTLIANGATRVIA